MAPPGSHRVKSISDADFVYHLSLKVRTRGFSACFGARKEVVSTSSLPGNGFHNYPTNGLFVDENKFNYFIDGG